MPLFEDTLIEKTIEILSAEGVTDAGDRVLDLRTTPLPEGGPFPTIVVWPADETGDSDSIDPAPSFKVAWRLTIEAICEADETAEDPDKALRQQLTTIGGAILSALLKSSEFVNLFEKIERYGRAKAYDAKADKRRAKVAITIEGYARDEYAEEPTDDLLIVRADVQPIDP